MKNWFRLATMMVGVALLGACSVQKGSESAISPTSPTSATSAGSQTIMTWASATSELPTGAGCSNFRWTVTSQTSSTISGSFTLLCLAAATVNGTATATITGDAVALTAQGTAAGQGVPANCTFTLTGSGTIQGTNSLPLTFTAQTCLGPISGRETLRRSTPQSPAPPPPPPVEPPTPPAPTPPPPPPTPVSNDAIDLNNATVVLGPSNIGSWPQTSTVTGTVSVEHSLCIYHTKLGVWPSGQFFDDPYTFLEGNQWVVANIGGRWYAGAADWYRPGQACKDVTADTIGRDAFYNPNQEPLHSWVPRVGEEFGLFSTTPARMWPYMRTLDERTNVVMARWGIR